MTQSQADAEGRPGAVPAKDVAPMSVGVFIPIGNNGWLLSENAPQYRPSFALNKQITLKAEAHGLDFALSMISCAASAARPSSGTTTSNRSP